MIQLSISFFFLLCPYLWQAEVPRPGIKPKPQLWQHQILNPLGQAGDPTSKATEMSQIINPLCHSGNSSIFWFYKSIGFSSPSAISLYVYFSVCLFFFFLLHLWHMEIPGPGIQPTPQQSPELLWQHQILNLHATRELLYFCVYLKTLTET